MPFLEPRIPRAPQLACACCKQPSAGSSWDTPLCEHHWAVLAAEMPSTGEVEAQATPDEVEDIIAHEFLEPEVVLKPGVLERRYREWVTMWVKLQRQPAVRLVKQ